MSGEQPASTAEQVMRARYSSFASGDVKYLETSQNPKTSDDLDMDSLKAWSDQATWLGLDVVSKKDGKNEDDSGEVEFKAHYVLRNKKHCHHEQALFNRVDGNWFFTDGKLIPNQVEEAVKVGRNEPCPCGSGKKFKKCCGA